MCNLMDFLFAFKVSLFSSSVDDSALHVGPEHALLSVSVCDI